MNFGNQGGGNSTPNLPQSRPGTPQRINSRWGPIPTPAPRPPARPVLSEPATPQTLRTIRTQAAKYKPSTPQNASYNHVLGMQKFLNSRGYHVTLDGILGPQTRSAVRALHSGISAGSWSQAFHHAGPGAGHQPARAGGGSGPPPVRGGGGGGGGNRGGGRGPARGSGGGGGRRGGGGNPLGNLNSQGAKIAASLTNEQFGPVLADLHRQAALGDLQAQQNLKDISAWYGQAGDQAKAAAAANAALDAQQTASFATQTNNLAASFGGSANPGAGEMQSAAAVEQGLLNQGATDNQSFDNNMQTMISATQADQLARQKALDEQNNAAIQAKLDQAEGQRAASLVTNRFNTMNQLTQREAALQNMQILAKKAGLDRALERQQINAARIGNQGSRIQNRANLLTVKQMIKQSHGGATASNWKQADKVGMENVFRSQLLGGNGGLRVSPLQAIQAINAGLYRMGFNTAKNKTAAAWAESLWSTFYNQSNTRNNPWRGWTWRNGYLYDPQGSRVYTFHYTGANHH